MVYRKTEKVLAHLEAQRNFYSSSVWY